MIKANPLMNYAIGMLLLLVCSSGYAQNGNRNIPTTEVQITTALLPAPEEDKAATMVYGYDQEGQWVVLRQGTGNLICLTDDPNKEGINVSCYSKKLDAFMQRGRELVAEGKTVQEIREIRGNEVAQGVLYMPKEPSMLYVYYGKDEDYDSETGILNNPNFRYVIYTPFATTASTGLPDKPHAKGMPWLMDPGTHRAHIMIGPN